jgi:hypothetical protein
MMAADGCDRVALQRQAIGGGKAFLVDIDLHRDRHAREYTGILTPRDRGVDGRRLLHHIVGLVIDHGVDLGIDGIEPRQRGSGGLFGRYLLRFDEGYEVGGRQAPEVGHKQLHVTADL